MTLTGDPSGRLEFHALRRFRRKMNRQEFGMALDVEEVFWTCKVTGECNLALYSMVFASIDTRACL